MRADLTIDLIADRLIYGVRVDGSHRAKGAGTTLKKATKWALAVARDFDLKEVPITLGAAKPKSSWTGEYTLRRWSNDADV